MNSKYALLFAFSCLLGSYLHGQSSCTYTLQLFDQFGDGWAGSEVLITSGQLSMTYTLDGENDNGLFREFDITLTSGDDLRIEYNAVSNFESDNSYILFNPEGIELFRDGTEMGQSPTAGVVFESTVDCPACLVVNPASVSIDDVRANVADISWTPTDPEGIYRIEYGFQGFNPGSGTVEEASGRAARLSELNENTSYDFYLSVSCADGTTSRVIGPFSFKTRWEVNVGVLEITAPETQCELGPRDSVKVVLKNFGGNPQSLIPFKYSVNGVDAGVPIPTDGFYTGVLGKDSIAEVAFETTSDFSTPGEYTIVAWTELEGDSLIFNDTATITITSIPTITEYPYFENFEQWAGGWTVDPDSKNSSWAFGQPAGNTISAAASGRNAWATNVAGLYNNSEFSVLLSPCLDFSGLQEDPNLGFALNFDSEECCDEAWVEVSIDGGLTWEKVGSAGSGINWYNNEEQDWWSGDGGFDGWVKVFNTLTGTAGQPEVRIRVIFSSDSQITKEGIGLDDIFITPPLNRDLAGLSLTNGSDSECGAPNDEIRLTVANVGERPAVDFDINYQVNGGPVVTQRIGTGTMRPGEERTFTFDQSFDSSLPGTYDIVAWTSWNIDAFVRNDTARLQFATAVEVPFGEDFESDFLPIGWTLDDDADITDEHQNTSLVLAHNLYQGNQSFTATTPVIGPIAAGDSLSFDYRIVNLEGDGNNPTELGEADMVAVQVSIDCGESYNTVFTINNETHQPGTELRAVGVQLTDFVGEYIKIRFLGSWGGGDYFVDLDNVYIPRCTGSLGLATNVVNISEPNVNDGSIAIRPSEGAAPYTYSWNTGDDTPTLSNLPVGEYAVTVTDRFGCTESMVFIIDIGVNTSAVEWISEWKLFPNPAGDLIRVEAKLPQLQTVQVQVLNMYGQLLLQLPPQRIEEAGFDVDLGSLPAGLYFMRMALPEPGQYFTKKFIKN